MPSEPATFAALRHSFQAQPELQITPIEKIRLPRQSRDELPPILAGLQWVWMHPTLKPEIFALLEAKILAGKKATGRIGMDLWQILVLGVVRLGLDANWDRLEHIANYDTLVRQMLGLPATPWADEAKRFGHQTLRDNVALLDDELLQQINARIAAAGRAPTSWTAAALRRFGDDRGSSASGKSASGLAHSKISRTRSMLSQLHALPHAFLKPKQAPSRATGEHSPSPSGRGQG